MGEANYYYFTCLKYFIVEKNEKEQFLIRLNGLKVKEHAELVNAAACDAAGGHAELSPLLLRHRLQSRRPYVRQRNRRRPRIHASKNRRPRNRRMGHQRQ